jgi:hypothetical protein
LSPLAVLVAGCGAPDASPGGSASSAAELASAIRVTAASSSAAPPPPAPQTPPLVAWLEREDPRWTEWLSRAEELRLQILVTEVDPEKKLTRVHELRVDTEYFYPASAVKPFLAVIALRFLSERLGGEVPLPARILRCRTDRPGCEPPPEDEDKEQPPGEEPRKHDKLRVGEEIGKMLSYSDNDSFNRLWDTVGHAEVNAELATLGFPDVRLHHRMSAPAPYSRLTPRVLVRPPGKPPIELPLRKSSLTLAATPAARLEIGTAYLDGKKLVESPMSFAEKNFTSLRDLQRLMIALVLPSNERDLGLSSAQREHLVRSMTTSPKDRRHAAEHSPLAPGVLDALGHERIRYVGKSGRAYGFHLENAYVENRDTGRAFFVTATVYANPDGVLNDDDYAYDELSRPLLASLGSALARELLVAKP